MGRGGRRLTGSLWPTQCRFETQVEGAEPGPKSPISPVKNSTFSREGRGGGGKGRGRGTITQIFQTRLFLCNFKFNNNFL